VADGIFVAPMRSWRCMSVVVFVYGVCDSYARMPCCRPSRLSRGFEALRAVTNTKLPVASFPNSNEGPFSDRYQ
jgi:hypothetical protein